MPRPGNGDQPVAGRVGREHGLSRWQAVPLAVGSVAGSGLLFLPSAVYAEAGGNSLLVWGVSILICVPMLLMFQDMVRSNPSGNSIAAFVEQGLGATLARCVPIMFVSLVAIGLPAGATVAGKYLARATGISGAMVLGAISVLFVALVTNLLGSRAGHRVQTGTTWALIGMAVVLVVTAVGSAQRGPAAMAVPDRFALSITLPTVVLAFWTFAGFENLTFLAVEFRHPRRDFLPVSVIALAGYGLFTVLLTMAIAIRIPRGDVEPVAGLLQLARAVHPTWVAVTVVSLVAVGAMVLNAVSWILGVSRVVEDAAGSGILPRALAVRRAGVPRRALGLLAVLFASASSVLLVRPSLIVDAVATASAIFILIYVACIVSYVRVRGLTVRTGLNAALLLVMVPALVQSGWRSLYGVCVLILALAVQSRARWRGGRPRSPGHRPADRIDADLRC